MCERTYAFWSDDRTVVRWSQIRTTPMLKLSDDWTQASTDRLTRSLLRQARCRRVEHSFARWIIWAAFDLAFATTWTERGAGRRPVEMPRFTWQIGTCVYRYLPRVDDRVVSRLTEDPLIPICRYLLVPPRMRNLLHTALEAKLKEQAPTVMDVTDFVSLRVLFSSIDAGWSHHEAVNRLVNAYNRRVEGLSRRELLYAASVEESCPNNTGGEVEGHDAGTGGSTSGPRHGVSLPPACP